MDYYPQRIICLTEEPTEVLYELGEDWRIVGISGFTVRPARARKEKPTVSAFVDADINQILELEPDLVIGFSDIQAEIARQLIACGVSVWINNHRSIEGIYKMIVQLGTLVGRGDMATRLADRYRSRLQEIETSSASYSIRPRVYFEEWYDPIISGIRWVSELIELAGGEDINKTLRAGSLAKDRIVKDPEDIVTKNPDIILVSWCGKKFKKEKLVSRNNWDQINAVKNNCIHEIKSSIILQPGPAAVTDGIEQITTIIKAWQNLRAINEKSLSQSPFSGYSNF